MSPNDRRDDELDALLAPLRDEAVPAELITDWQRSVQVERGRRALRLGRRAGWRAWWPVTAALLVGFALGALTMRARGDRSVEAVERSTTIETIYAKAE